MSNSLADMLMATVPDRRKSGATRKDNVGKRAMKRREKKAKQDPEKREQELADARTRSKLRYERLKKLARLLALETPSPELASSLEDERMDTVQWSEDSFKDSFNVDTHDNIMVDQTEQPALTIDSTQRRGPVEVSSVNVDTLSRWLLRPNLHFYEVEKSAEALQEYHTVEWGLRGEAVPGWHPVIDNALRISKPGEYMFMGEGELVAAVRITPMCNVPERVKNAMGTMVDYCSLVRPIRSNGAMNRVTRKCGTMCALGWHPGYQKDSAIAAYGPVGQKTWGKLIEFHDKEHPAELYEVYIERFKSLCAGNLEALMTAAREAGAPNLGLRNWSGASDEHHLAGANVLTITYNGFCNTAHRDKDKSPQAFGMWWTGKVANDRKDYLDETTSHGKVRGGGFYFPEYEILVDFENAGDSLVEVFWRGCLDYHVTLGADESKDATRWGTSIQLTKSVADRTAQLAEMPNGRKVFVVDDYCVTYGQPIKPT